MGGGVCACDVDMSVCLCVDKSVRLVLFLSCSCGCLCVCMSVCMSMFFVDLFSVQLFCQLLEECFEGTAVPMHLRLKVSFPLNYSLFVSFLI